jgi:chromosome segregation ATPase
MDALFTVIFETVLMHEECEKWEDKPAADKTWHNFQAHFLEAQRKLKRRQRTTTTQGGFHGVNTIVNEQIEHANDALVNLMTNAATDRDEIRQLTKTIQTQNDTIAAFAKTLASINTQLTKLTGTQAAPAPAVAPEDILKDFMWTAGTAGPTGTSSEKPHQR